MCAMEIQSWQASRQLCKRGAFHSALLVKVAACNIGIYVVESDGEKK